MPKAPCMHSCGPTHSRARGLSFARSSLRAARGFTMIELAITVAIISALMLAAIPSFNSWQADQEVKSAAMGLKGALSLARSEALRTGHAQIVFFGGTGIGSAGDPTGNPIDDVDGNLVPVLVLDDGEVADANCEIEAGEPIRTMAAVDGISWGVSKATVRAPLDTNVPGFAPGVTFADPSAPNTAVHWVGFRPDGIPIGLEGTTTGCGEVGGTGSGSGGLYITNGTRDYAVVLTPLGGVRVHVWNPSAGAWSP